MEGAIIPRVEDEFVEYIQQKKRRGRATSIVWEHFDKLKDEVDNVWKTQCKHCKQIYSSAQKNGTSHLKRHMDRCPIIRASGLIFPTVSTPIVSDGLAGYESSNKRSRSVSKVWEDFEKLKAERDDILKARCIHCKQILSGASKHGTSHLKRHLERCPKRRNHEVRQLLLSSEVRSIKQLFSSNEALVDGSTPLKKCALDQTEILKAISAFIICGKHSVTLVEELGFRQMMTKVCPEFENVNAQAIRRKIFSSYLKERESLKELLGRIPGRICLTCENWSSDYSKNGYMCITAHFIDNDWKLVKKIIYFKPLVPPFNGTLFADEIALCLSMWNIDTKIFTITSSNASYDDNFVDTLKGCLLAKKNLLIGGCFFQVRSCCQILDIIVKAIFNLVDDVVDKIRSGIEHIRKFTSRKKKFYMIASKEFQLDTKKRLHPDVYFRWNTTYMMIERALYYKSMLQYWGEHDSNFLYYNLSAEEWEKLAIIQKFLAVFYELESAFSTAKHPTSNLYFRALWKVHMHLLKAVRGPFSFMTRMATDMQEKFEKYWIKHNLILSCAAVLDPRYKVKLVEFCYTKIYGDKAEDFVNTTVRTLYGLFDEYKPNFVTSSSCTRTFAAPAVAEHGNVDKDEFEDYEQFLSRKSRPQGEKSQLDLYLEEPGPDFNSDINVLEYWNNSSMRYPELAMMARDILTIPMSSAFMEASFNIGKRVLHSGQSLLDPKMVQALVCLSDWTYSALEKLSGTSMTVIHENGDPCVSDEENDLDDLDIEEGTFP
ncbi:zinc finger BED domain-containing protein RICESLEEPER 2-like [Phalaenopsis equestris]|uniref:zinc finger BED domain-containing protein RICESLEEPER 2-like n=1 Tax=Phalaenopsis equestris TaxID=78828 RepID=UPI0009E37CA1|nr:zinc finger BED domain-containing protein RICESLEEPER 2-like [Phalaenopsis equestris]